MSVSTMLEDMRGASKEVVNTVKHNDGRQTIYIRDVLGRESFTLIGPRGQFQGNYPLTRPIAPEPR